MRLAALERQQEAAQFVRATTGKQMQQMKQYYDASVKPQRFEEGTKVLVFLSEEEERTVC